MRGSRRCRASTAVGIDMHIGSQIDDMAPFDNAYALMAELVRDLRAQGHNIHHVDVGGGLGIPYHADEDAPPLPVEYAEIVRKHLAQARRRAGARAGPADRGQCRHPRHDGRVCEGRRQELRHRRCGDERPDPPDALRSRITTSSRCSHSNLPPITADVVGPVCETGDYLALGRRMPGVKQGDLLAVMSAGAYGAVMASTYNSRPLVPEVLVDGDRWHVIRPRRVDRGTDRARQRAGLAVSLP